MSELLHWQRSTRRSRSNKSGGLMATARLAVLALLVVGIVGLTSGQEPPKPLSAETKKAMEKVRQLGGHVMEIAQNDNRLEASYAQLSTPIKDEHLAALKDLPGLIDLNLR